MALGIIIRQRLKGSQAFGKAKASAQSMVSGSVLHGSWCPFPVAVVHLDNWTKHCPFSLYYDIQPVQQSGGTRLFHLLA